MKKKNICFFREQIMKINNGNYKYKKCERENVPS